MKMTAKVNVGQHFTGSNKKTICFKMSKTSIFAKTKFFYKMLFSLCY